jgi:PAP2 superfamily
MRKRPPLAAALILLLACATTTTDAQTPPAPVQPGAAGWHTWVIGPARDHRLPPPPDNRVTAGELQQLQSAARQRDAAALDQIRYWDFRAPSHRWNAILTDILTANPMRGGDGIRAFALLNVAIDDAMVAAWDSKYAHNRRRPTELDGTLTAAVTVPQSPSYPCEHSVAAGAAAAVLAHIYPNEAQRVTEAAEEASRSRVLAAAVFPSDAQAGLELGRKIAARVIEYAKIDGVKWTGIIPSGPGLWKGENPGGVDDVHWKTFVLTSPSQFRPVPPPAYDSPERAAELAEVKNFKRTPLTNSKAAYWQFGQQGQPGLLLRLSEEVGLRLAEAGIDGNAPRAARAYALVHVAHYDGWVASQDAKFHYWTARPNHFDPTITTVLPTPSFPTYPSNAATLGMGPGIVLGYLFPREAARYAGWVREFGESRFWAGIHFKSDIDAGWEIGRRVGEAVVERAKRDQGS